MAWGRSDKDSQQVRDNGERLAVLSGRWEYLVEEGNFDAGKQQRRCNELGQSGWELVGVLPISRPSLSEGGRTTSIQLYFKRPRP